LECKDMTSMEGRKEVLTKKESGAQIV